MTHDSDYFRQRAAEARNAACRKDAGEDVEVAGHLALAYTALARRGRAIAASAGEAVDPAIASIADPVPLMLRD